MFRVLLKGIHAKPATQKQENDYQTRGKHNQGQVSVTSLSADAITVMGREPREHTEA